MNHGLPALFAALVFVSPQALAADLPPRPMQAAPVLSSVPVYNWTGIYLGVNGGYAFGKQDPLSLFSNDYDSLEYSVSGWTVGGTIGGQIQSGRTVIGIEGDLAWANIGGTGAGTVTKLGVVQGTAALTSDVSAIGTLRTRIGYAADNWLYYGTIGLAATKATSAFTQGVGVLCNTPGQVSCTSKADLHIGVAAGGGVEYGITQSMSAKVEYLWLGAGAGNTLKANWFRAGLNFRFGGS